MSDPIVFVGIPSYGDIVTEALPGLHLAAQKCRFYLHPEVTSLTPQTFNVIWIKCLNHRHQGITHWAMHHSDVEAEMNWLDALMEEKERVGADILSVVIPIKDNRGLTTTGVLTADGGIRRLTMREVMKLPETFSIRDISWASQEDRLVVNTGLWVCKLDPWVDAFPGFAVLSEIRDDPQDADKKRAHLLSEDWNFSRWANQQGLRIFATRKVKVKHWGHAFFPNDHAWGELETDVGDNPGSQGPPKTTTEPAKPEPVVRIPLPKQPSREIVAVRFAESMAWVHGWLDDLIIKHGPNLTYRIYDKGPGGDTENVGNLDGTYLLHIVNEWNRLADWTVFTQADPFPHLVMPGGAQLDFYKTLLATADILSEIPGYAVPFTVKCREWDDDGRLHWHLFPEPWKRRYKNGSIYPAKLSFREWVQKYLDIDIEKLGALEYHPGAIFGVSRDIIQRRPKAFYERLLASLTESRHPCPEEAHHLERVWPIVLGVK